MVIIIIISLVLSLASAATPPSSTFVQQDVSGENFTISVNVPEINTDNDLYFSMSAPSGQGWIAFGLGIQMKGSLIFLAYPSEDGKNVTLSPRLGKGHVMPELYQNTTTQVLTGSGITDERFVVNAMCTSCRSWDGGSLDITSTSQPMIYALGDPKDVIQSNSESATIKQHYAEGKFTLNMRAATGLGGIPVTDASGNSTTVVQDDPNADGSVGRIVHAILMAGSFVIAYPLGALFLRTFGKVWMHWLTQALTTFAVVLGAAAGIYISIKHDKNPRLNSAHQGIGLTVTIIVLIQLTLGFIHHRLYRKTGSPTILGKIHRILGPAVILFGIINGAVGFNFAGNHSYTITYSLIVFIIAIGCLSIWLLKRRRQRRKEAMTSVAAQNFRQPDMPLNAYGQYGQHGGGWQPNTAHQ